MPQSCAGGKLCLCQDVDVVGGVGGAEVVLHHQCLGLFAELQQQAQMGRGVVGAAQVHDVQGLRQSRAGRQAQPHAVLEQCLVEGGKDPCRAGRVVDPQLAAQCIAAGRQCVSQAHHLHAVVGR